MRTTVIPAQITTVEDKIAGNLNFTQVLLLLAPVMWTGLVFTVFTPSMKLSFYKIPLILIITCICTILAIRIKGKLVLEWVMLITTFNLRPRFYLFDKNDDYVRVMDLPVLEKKPLFTLPTTTKKQKAKSESQVHVSELIRLEQLMSNHSLSFKTTKRGGFNVAIE